MIGSLEMKLIEREKALATSSSMQASIITYSEKPFLEYQSVVVEGPDQVRDGVDIDCPKADKGVVGKQLHLFTRFLGLNVFCR